MAVGRCSSRQPAAASCATGGGELCDRRRVTLVGEGLPAIPHHVEAQSLEIDEAVALIERVRASAGECARVALDATGQAIPGIGGIALRQCPALPPTVAERITNVRARNVADWVMYREALAGAAIERGWRVHWYDPRKVLALAGSALGVENPDVHFAGLRRLYGAPWGADQRLAMAASIAAAGDSEAALRAAPRRQR